METKELFFTAKLHVIRPTFLHDMTDTERHIMGEHNQMLAIM